MSKLEEIAEFWDGRGEPQRGTVGQAMVDICWLIARVRELEASQRDALTLIQPKLDDLAQAEVEHWDEHEFKDVAFDLRLVVHKRLESFRHLLDLPLVDSEEEK